MRPRSWASSPSSTATRTGPSCRADNPFAYAVGFVIATGMLHLLDIVFGLLARWPAGIYAVSAGGAAISLVGCAFLFGVA